MDALFGDATTAMGTPATLGTPSMRAEADALIRPGSPIPPLDIPNRAGFGSSNALPGLDIDPPQLGVVDGKPKLSSHDGQGSGIGAWLSRMIGRGKSDGGSSARYAPLGQGED
jgi:hypothetical protein